MDDRVRAEDVADMVLGHIARAGDNGISIPKLVEKTGLRYRVLHNVTWTLEGSPEPSRASANYGVPRYPDRIRARRLESSDGSVRYAAVETAAISGGTTKHPAGTTASTPVLERGRFLVNAAGDVYGREIADGLVEEVDPDTWGWASPTHHMPDADRHTIDELAALPGFSVTITATRAFVPGPKQRGTKGMQWPDGAAPPAHYQAARGASGYYSRLSEVLGYIADSLPRNPDSSPYVVHDFVGGRRIEVHYRPPTVEPGGDGLVYILDDGIAFKFGHTTQPPALRVNNLQTGNPRLIHTVATIAPASVYVEAHLHRKLDAWVVRGEWYERDPILAAVDAAGGWEPYLRLLLPDGTWDITTHKTPESMPQL